MASDQLAAVFKSFEWIIQHTEDRMLEEQSSPTLCNENIDFRIRMSPYNGSGNQGSSRGGVSMFLDVVSVPPRQKCCIVKFVITIRNQKDRNLSVSMDDEKVLDPSTLSREDTASWGFGRFMSQDLLVDGSAGYLVDGNIAVDALLSVQTLRSAPDGETRRDRDVPDDEASNVRVVVRSNSRYPVTLVVASSEDLLKHVGPGLVNFDRVHTFSVSASMSASELREKLQREIMEDAAILPCQVVEGPRGRAFPTRVDIQKPLKDIQMSRNSVQDLVRPLGAREWRLILLKREHTAGMDEGGILAFFKFFDNETRTLELVGDSVLGQLTTISSLIPMVNEMVGLMPTEPLLVWLDTGSGSPRSLQEGETCEGIGLVSGAVLYFQKVPGQGAEASGLAEYLAGFSDRSSLSLHPLHQGGQLVSLNVGSGTSGMQLLSEISKTLTLSAGTHVSLFLLDTNLGGPRACAVAGEELSQSLSVLLQPPMGNSLQRTAFKILYYEVRRSTAADRTVDIAWFGPQVVEERVFNLTVNDLTTVGEILGRLRQMGPLRGTGDLRLVGTWRHRIVWVAGGGGGGQGFACGEEGDALCSIHCQVALRAEEVADDAFGSTPLHRLVQVAQVRVSAEAWAAGTWRTRTAEPSCSGEPFLLSVAPDESVARVWGRAVAKLGARSGVTLACVAPGSAPTLLEESSACPALQLLAESPGSHLAILHHPPEAASTALPRAPAPAHSAPPPRPQVPAPTQPQTQAPAPDPPAPHPGSALPAAALQPGLWARLNAAVESAGEGQAAQPSRPRVETEPAALLSFPLPIPHSSPLPSPVDRAVDLAFELESVKAELLEERLLNEGLEQEVRRLMEERLDDRMSRHRLEDSLDDAQAELASALEQNTLLQHELRSEQTRAEDKEAAAGPSPVEVVKDLTENHVQQANMPTLNALEIAAKDLLAKIFQVRKAKKGVPDSFLCPITQDIMQDPTGHTYERTAIERWFESNSTDPKTNVQLHSKAIVPNHGLRATIEEYQANR